MEDRPAAAYNEGSPGFLLRPPRAPASTQPHRELAGSDAEGRGRGRNGLKLRARLDQDNGPSSPSRHTGSRPDQPGPPATRSSPLGPAHGPHALPALSRPPGSDVSPAHHHHSNPQYQQRREPEAQYITRGSSHAGTSCGGGGGSGGGGRSGGDWAGSSGGGGHNSGVSSGGVSEPAFASGRHYHDSFNSHRSPMGKMPDYLKVYTVPKDVQYEEDIIIEPIIQALGLGDKEMERRIMEQMGNLFEFFRRLKDQDADEIRDLQLAVAQRDSELRNLQQAVERGQLQQHQQHMEHQQQHMQNQQQHLQHMQHMQQLQLPNPPSPSQWKQGPPLSSLPRAEEKQQQHVHRAPAVVSMVVPPVLSPARPFFKWWANVYHCYARRTTMWLGIVFLLLLILAIGLLAGLLSRDANRSSSDATPYMPYSAPGPAVTSLWSTGFAFSVNMTQGATAVYALVPAVSMLTANFTPAAADVRTLLQGPAAASRLRDTAAACGERTAVQGRHFTWAVTGSEAAMAAAISGALPTTTPAAAAAGQGAALADAVTGYCEVPGALQGRCNLCPDVRPATSYVLLVAFEGSDAIFQLPLTTAPANSSPPPPPSLPPGTTASSPSSSTSRAPDFTTAPSVTPTGQTSLSIALSLSAPGVVRYLVVHSVLYAQAGGSYVSYASADPVSAGQALAMAPPPFTGVVGVGGVVAAGAVNVTQAGAVHTIRVDGNSNSTLVSGSLGACLCGGVSGSGGCTCIMPAPCLGAMCSAGPSALTPGATYKVFVSSSSPDVASTSTSNNGNPVYAGSVTTTTDTSGPVLAAGAGVPAGAVTPTSLALSGVAMDTAGLAYVMVTRPLAASQQEATAPGTATALTEQAPTARRRSLQQHWQREVRSGGDLGRSLLQDPGPTIQAASTDTGGGLAVVDPAPATQVFTPSCPRVVACDTAKVEAAYLDSAAEVLAAPTRCMVLSNVRDGPTSQLVTGLVNDTAYVLRVITEDVYRNQRVYRAAIRTEDLRPPEILSVVLRPGFRAINLSVTLSEPGALTGFLYTTSAAANLTFASQTSYPPSAQGPIIQQASAATTFTPDDRTSPTTGPTTYILAFNDPTIIARSNYSVALFARDLPGNVQPRVRVAPVSTEDNIPPQWLAASVRPGAYDAALTGMLDEPATVYYFALRGNITCPTAAQLFQVADTPTAAANTSFAARGSAVTSSEGTSPSTFGTTAAGLFDGTTYTLCLVAQDASPLRNRQATPPQRLVFDTQDRTPPLLTAAAVASSEGDFTCDRSRYFCRLDLNVSLSEAGTAYLALQYSPAPTTFNTSSLVGMNVSDPAPSVLRAGSLDFSSRGWQVLQLNTLASGRSYSLSVAAADTAGNLQARLVTLVLAAPDIIPPLFTRTSAMGSADTVITANVSLNEAPCTVLWMARPAESPTPDAATVVAASADGGNDTAQPGSGSAAYAPANNTSGAGYGTWDVRGLSPGQLYDIHLVARDAAGNTQPAVTTVPRVRTHDSSSPAIFALTATVASTGNRLTLSVNASKPGTLLFLAIRAGGPVPTRQQLLLPSTYPSPSFANFSGQVTVSAAAALASAGFCVADGAAFQIWAVLEDLEGTFPNRLPNYSNVSRATQVLATSSSATCSPETRMRSLQMDIAVSSGSLGWPVGRLTQANSTGSSSNVSWVQEFALVGGLGGSVGSTGAIVASVEGLPLGAYVFQPARPPPAKIRVVLQTPTLYMEPSAVSANAASEPGRMLRFAFQLTDSAMRTTIGAEGLRLVPALTTTLATSSDGRIVLPECGASSATSTSVSGSPAGGLTLVGGAGACSVEVPALAFAAPGGSASASLQVDVFNGSVLLLSSAAAQVSLRTAVAVAVTAPTNGTALLLALPARPLRAGETFRVTLSAIVSSQQAISGFSIPLNYRASRITFVRAERSPLWSDLVAVSLTDGADASGDSVQLWLTALARTAPDTMYRGRTIALLDAYFTVATNAAAIPDAGTDLPILSVSNSSSLYPYDSTPVVRMQDYRTAAGGGSSSGSASVLVVRPQRLALFAYLTSHDLFNSAVLDGKDVLAPIQALVVSDWAAGQAATATLAAPVSGSAACACAAPSDLVGALAIDGCRVALRAAHSQPTKQAALSMDCGATALQTEVTLTVWFPNTFRVESADPDDILSSILPMNVPPPPAGSCVDRYQSTQLQLFATWINGGNGGPADFLSLVDVSRLAANWTTDQPLALRLAGATATGTAPTAGATVSALASDGSALASTRLAVSDTPVCVESLDVIAVSGVDVVGEAAGQPVSPGRWRLRFTPQQALNWEQASARVNVFAALSDGTAMPVSRASTTTAVQLSSSASTGVTIPFRLRPLTGFASLSLLVNASFGSLATCGPYLETSWSVCSGSQPMGTGTGLVRVALPTPTRVSALLLSSDSIARPGSGAAQAPISVPTRAALTVMVDFSDGSERDMTADPRVEVLVSQGADLCSVQRDVTTNEPYVQAATTASAGGTCRLEARVSFSALPQMTATNSTTVVTLTSLQVYVVDGALAPAAPPAYATNSSSFTDLATTDASLRLFKCDFSHYMPASVWVMGRLSSCGTSCTLADLNDPTSTSLALSTTAAVSLAPNPSNARLTNMLAPIQPGRSALSVSFGSGAASATYNVSVEDTFHKGWPRATNITDTGFLITANMTSATFRVTYLARRPAVSAAGDTVPLAAEVERVGVALNAVTAAPGGSGHMLSALLSGLAPANNYTIFLAVRYQSRLLGTVVAITGVLTPDYVAPTFAMVGAVQNLTLDSQRFNLQLPVALSEAGNISYAIYRNATCITGVEQVPVSTVLSASPLSSGSCTCSDASACQPVAFGSVALGGDLLNDTLTLSGLLPPNPYNALRGATEAQLTCRTDPLPSPASTAHALYLVAQDDLPTYRGWNVTCNPPASSPGSTCGAAAQAPCSAIEPTPGSIAINNLHALPYTRLALKQGAAASQGGPARPVLASFDLPAGDRVAFDAAATNITASAATITFAFRVSRVSAVQYRLDQFNGTSVFSGVLPVFDPQVAYRVSISRTCAGGLLDEPSYSLWYWATDVYGKSSAAVAASVVLQP